MVAALVTDAAAVEPEYREVRVSFSAGRAFPTGDWDYYMESGPSAHLDVGITLHPRFDAGVHVGLGTFDNRYLGPFEGSRRGEEWTRYAGGIFGEYTIRPGRLAPFVGGHIGMHGVHLRYIEVIDDIEGRGEYGFGYGLSCGLRYRGNTRYGFLARFDAESSTGMRPGWFLTLQLGVSFYL